MNDAVRTMRAMCASSSDPASLIIETVPVPDPGPGELLVEVRGTAITAGELSWPESWPAIPCHDLSGVVTAAGDGAHGWQPGDEVYGLVGFDRPGAAAEYVTAPAADLAPKPASVDHLAAAAVPLGALTAWQALHEHAQLAAGQHVLVHGGAGGVGAYAVQLAALAGARVTATASARDLAFVTGLGAHAVLDYSGRFEDHVRDVDVVIDPVGGNTTARAAVDQDMLPGSQLRVLMQRLPGRKRAERDGGGREMIHRGGLEGKIGGGSGNVLGGRAGAVETDQAVNFFAGLPAGGSRARRSHYSGHVVAGDGRPALRPGQLVGRDRGGADLDQQFPRPRIGDRNALAGQAGRIGARCVHGAHRADGIVHGRCPSSRGAIRTRYGSIGL